MREDQDWVALLVNLSFMLAIAVAFLTVHSKMKRARGRNLRELASPLLLPEPDIVATDHRLDAATREASKGFLVCGGCSFENFQSATNCAVCGDPLAAQGGDASADVNTPARPRLADAVATPRQRRARRRKEWTRKLDVQGRMFWYRADAEGERDPRRPTEGKVVRFSTNCMRSVTPPPSVDGDDGGDSDADPAAEVVERAKVFSDVVPMEIVAASEADAAARSTGEALESAGRRRDVAQLASKDFPTKYAHFVVNSAALLVPAEVEFLKLSVHRDYVLEESVEHLGCIEDKYIRSVLRINFLEESGVDAGGLQREWFMMLNDLLLDPAAGLFKCTNEQEQTFYLNPSSRQENGEDHLIYYYATGRLLGRALLEGTVLNFHLCAPLLKLILGVPVTFDDLESFDPELFRSLTWLLDHDGVEALQLDFSVTERRGGAPATVDLVPGGRSMAVTDANKRQYAQSLAEYHLLSSVSSQLYVLLRGLYGVIPAELLMAFDAEELEYMLCGSPEIDVRDWEAHSEASPTILHTPTLAWFWEIVREMPNAYRRRLLQFSTGCSRVPLVGFKGLTSYDGRVCHFSLKGMPKTAHPCVRSYACFNRLDLPLGTSREQLRAMLYATLDTELYGFTTS